MAEIESNQTAANNPIFITENYIVQGRQCVDSDGHVGWLAESFGVEGLKRSLWIVEGTIYGAGIVDSAGPGRPAVEIYGEAKRVEPQREMDVLRAVAHWSSATS
jgi:hypothetical protein